MVGRSIKSGARIKAEQAIIEGTNNEGFLPKHKVNHVLSKDVLKSILDRWGYVDTYTTLSVHTGWTIKARETVEHKEAVVSSGKRRAESLGTQCKNALIRGELVVIDEQPICKKYVMQIVQDLRKNGYIIKSNLNNKKEVVSYQVANINHKPKPAAKRVSRVEWVNKKMLKDGFFNVEDFDGSNSYLLKIMCRMRSAGHEIKTIREGYAAVRYELVKQ